MTDVHRHRPLLNEELQRIRDTVARMGELVEAAIIRAVQGLIGRSLSLCEAVVETDTQVNELQREVRETGFLVLLTQAPVAIDLRELLSGIQMASELERMGDHAVSIAKLGRGVIDAPPAVADEEITRLADLCTRQLRDILEAMAARDVEQARTVASRDDQVDRVYHRLVDILMEDMVSQSPRMASTQLFVAHHLERIGDRVTNLAEDLVFLETGEIVDLG